MKNARDLVKDCLNFNYPSRIPRDLWILPWAQNKYQQNISELLLKYPTDIEKSARAYPSDTEPRLYRKGYAEDEWGCRFYNLHDGIIGEISEPLLKDIRDWKTLRLPWHLIPAGDVQKSVLNKFSADYENSEKFIISNTDIKPWERYQFIRGPQNALSDFLENKSEALHLLNKIHQYYLEELQVWLRSDIDAIYFMDDWGTQDRLLIDPDLWRDVFKPLYRQYCELAKSNGKFVFMHTDGNVTDILPDLVEIGVDALNSQLFCMDFTKIAETVLGRLTLWGEIDRQQLLPSRDSDAVRSAVRQMADFFYRPDGGLIAQFEYGIDINPRNAQAVFEEWLKIKK